MRFKSIKQEFVTAKDRFVTFVKSPFYQIKKQPLISQESLVYYVIALSIVPVAINLIFSFGFMALWGIAAIPIMSLIAVFMWLVVGYLVHVVAFPKADKKYDLNLVANIAAFSNTFFILAQPIRYLNVILWLFGFVLFCEAYSARMELPKEKVYIAFAIGAFILILPLIFAFRFYRL